MAIGTTIKTIQDIMRKDAGVDGDAQRISQLGWMIFLKIFDDREAEKELLDEGYRSPIPAKLRWRAWAKNPEGITGEELLDFVNNELFKTLKELSLGGKNAALAGVVKSAFEDAYNYMKSGTLMRQVINKLNEIDFNKASDRHEFGDVYEKILSDLQSAGNAGEYYTPRAVTQFIVDQIDPKLGETILDPACGTGGFLTCAIEHVRKKYVKGARDEATLQAHIFGVEKKPMPHLLCVTNMIFHGIDVPSQIRHDNTLARPLRDYGPKDRVDVIITNPPFGGMEEDGIETNFPTNLRTRETADLFLVLMMTLLKPGGRGAIVLPDGTLFGTGVTAKIKEKLLEECGLHTVVRLPPKVFAPYTDIKTNILFFTKGEPTEEIAYYEHPYPPGYKSYSKGKPLRIEEFLPEKKWWKKREENPQAWSVSLKDVQSRGYDLDIGNPHTTDDGPGDPAALVGQHRGASDEVAAICATLEDEFRAAFDRTTSVSSDPSQVDPSTNGVHEHTLLENLRTLAKAGGGVKRLRQLVLGLAVRGLLVPQIEAEGTSEALLRQLELGRKRLAGTARVRPDLPEVAEAERPFGVPSSWCWVRLAQFGGFVGGGTPSKANPSFWRGPIPWVSPKDMKRAYIEDAEDHISRAAVEESATKLIPARSLLMVVRGMILAHSFPVALTTREVTINQDMKALLLAVPEVGEFLLRACWAARGQVLRHVRRSAHGTRRLDADSVEELPIPLPPLQEQRRIVDKVEQLMRLCDDLEAKLHRAEATAAKFAETVVAEMVGA